MSTTKEAPPVAAEETPKRTPEEIVAALLPYTYPPEWIAYVKTLNVFQRLHGATADLGPMRKDREMDGGNVKFRYHGHAAITANVKAALEKWRVGTSTTVLEETHENIEIGKYKTPGYFTTARVLVTFRNIDQPDDQVAVEHVGYGQDTSDKGIGKAVTYATKYAQIKMLMISDGEEPDNEAFDWEKIDAHENSKRKAAQNGTNGKGSAQQNAARKLSEAERDAGIPPKQQKPVSKMTGAEIFAAIVTELSPLGCTLDMFKKHLKEHDKAENLKEVPLPRLIAIYQWAKPLRIAFDTAFRVAESSTDPEANLTELHGFCTGAASVFELSKGDFERFTERLLDGAPV